MNPILYLPFLILYMHGDPVAVKLLDVKPEYTVQECLKDAGAEVTKALEGAPEGLQAVGGCLPIPTQPPETKKA